MKNVSFYKFVELDNLKSLKQELLLVCKKNNIKGKILIAHEGINAMISGEEHDVTNFISYMHSKKEFDNIVFKESKTKKHNYKRTLVKIRNEIITMKQNVDMCNIAPHLSPDKLKQMYDNNEEFIIIDTRNDYEYELGHFKGALNLNMKEFREFPRIIENIRNELENKTVVTYCTGGIRCEKATAYMVEQGLKNIYQLEGGIINYGQTVGDEYWVGQCFVFDDRGAIEIDPEKQTYNYTQCDICYIPNKDTHTCPQCGKEFYMCSRCMPLMDNCCSKFCRNKLRKEKNTIKSTL